MGKINMGRWILGGVVAGIVVNLLGYVVDGLMLAPRWAVNMSRLGRPAFTSSQMVWFNVIGIGLGLLAVWVYAAIRPRFGAGMRTAICAGIAVWVATSLLPNATLMWATGLFNNHLTLYTTAGALIELVVGTVAGAALYREESVAEAGAAATPRPQTARA
ncbi:MAG TPA: hypothetical protein VHU89_15485 [Acidobacteriaceae bacterium]|jgi:hypothetical protein|nr:hypothetical protein [Acidobacteriaceae bacterium]